MRAAAVIIVFTVTASAFAQSTSFQVHGFLTARAISVESQPSWTEGGFGRFDVGGQAAGNRQTENVQLAQAGFDWTPTRWLLIHADGVARHEPSGTIGSRGGVVQAFADLFTEHLRLRVGSFWFPTSRENVDLMWNSRYTITYSALNTWIGQEFRPVGADVQFSPNFYITGGATAFRGNDTMGTELAARGWTFGNRLTVYNEKIALPPPDDLTKPIGSDIDHRIGFAERLRLQIPERAMVQFAHIDNRAELYPTARPPDIPWATRFNVVSAEAGSTPTTTVAAEWARGRTAVGFPGGSFTMDFDTAYVLASQKRGRDRWTTRIERFSTHAHKRSPYDTSRESGHAYTVAWLRDLSEHLRGGVEYVRVTGDRPGLSGTAFDVRTGGSTITAELRIGF
ncbi:MAG TPA: hypothetical protein VLV78_10950 [Thermoanaerobaculia bacterium]|nr:hypothetical protein [Thermoanaerobaculia bacterium]